MHGSSERGVFVAAAAAALVVAVWLLPGGTAYCAELDLRPITAKPEPLGQLHPTLRWMTKDKLRVAWIGDGWLEQYPGSDKAKSEVLVDAGFNLVRVSMGVNSDNTPSGIVDTSKPLALKHDRSRSTSLETTLAANVAEARRVGVALMVGWQYGTHHLEPYRKYRTAKGELHKVTCCPLDETYITGQHIGKWAVKLAEGGADGMVIDMEMYHSDTHWFRGPCTCDVCFATYLKRYAGSWRATYDDVAAADRGSWLAEHAAEAHYAAFAAQRIEALYDSIRRRCQEINPAFFFGVAPQLNHLPGVMRGLGTASVPSLAFGEHEYHHGPYRGSFQCKKQCREQLPTLYLCGAWVGVQPPEMLAESALQGMLYTDGWWVYYGWALLNDPDATQPPWNGYGRVLGTTARDYLDRITAVHAEVDRLLLLPQDQWPPRQDGKLNWLKAKVTEARAAHAEAESAASAKALAEAEADFEKYMGYVRQGGY